ncbi:MAG: response regulator [Lentimicrobium sp.]|nr:response regulator [Lentimicrobium sp.]
MKTEKIRILFVEDVAGDLNLAVNELQEEKVDFSWLCVQTWDDFIKNVEEYKPDIVVCDYSMPAFNGLDTIRKIIAFLNNVPMILYSESLDSETAIACMKSGVADIVMKSNLNYLPRVLNDVLVAKKAHLKQETEEKSLWESENHYRAFLNSLGEKAYLKDEEFRYIIANQSIQSLLGKKEQEIIGKTDFDLMAQELAEIFMQADKTVTENLTTVVTTHTINDLTYESRKFPVTFSNGKTGVGGLIHEITTQTDNSTSVNYLGALNSSSSAYMLLDATGTILAVNPAYTKLTGFTEEEVRGEYWIELLTSEFQKEAFFKEVWNTLLKEKLWHGRMINPTKDKALFNEEVLIMPVLEKDSIFSMFIVKRQRITAQRADALENERIRQNYKLLIDNASLGTFIATFPGILLQVNQTMVKMLDTETINGTRGVRISGYFRYPEQWKVIQESIKTNKKVRNYGVELITKNGKLRHLVLNAIPIGNQIMCMAIDTTSYKINEGRLIAEKNKSDEKDRLRNIYLASMSHDISSMVNTIQGFTNMLKATGLNINDKAEYVDLVHKTSHQLLRIVNDYIEFTKVVTDQIITNPVSFELNSLVKELYTLFNPMASARNLELNYHLGLTDDSSRIRFDDRKLRQILFNLIDNAIKFSDNGNIDFGYEVKDAILEFYVKDTGRGISSERQKNIFDRFRVFGDHFTRKSDGSGLGLPLVKAYIEFLGGEIKLISKPYKGSSFIFKIPWVPDEIRIKHIEESKSGLINLHKRKILVAEDDETNYIFMERLLTKANATILRAVNGQEAIDRCASDPNIDLVLMDINMPNVNGLDATRIIKSRTPGLPIIAVTAYSLCDDKETCLAAGCDDYIPKPVHTDELYLKVSNCLVN